MSTSSIQRVGIIVKPHQPDALHTICGVVEWLAKRGITLAGTADIDRERIEHETGCAVETLEPDELRQER